MCVVSALDDYLKRTKTSRTNKYKFQLLLNHIKPHLQDHNSTIVTWINMKLKETGLILMFLIATLPQKHAYYVFQ